ncbi:MAG: LTA synthase family protein, partial [Candidatus Electryoneaceae bacterium]|nr:LTA synthase family protein [Candidatus Electryoneaceae bacterium]
GYTPFLDSLMQQSLSFKGFANGEKSMDAIPSILSGIPSMMNRSYLVSSYVGNNVESLASKLKENGYATAFYHGGTNGTMGFESYSKVAGFDNYYGRTEYKNEDDFDGDWGIFDGPFLQYMASTLNETPQPFFATVFTLSSHHPYVLPDGFENRFPKGTLDIHETVAYADDALREFFKTASMMPWFNNTLFVITSDHTFPPYFDEYKTAWGRYSVPIVFYSPEDTLKSNKEITVQHIDILPSILDYVNYNGKYFSYGSSVFDDTEIHFAVSYLPTTYQLIKGDYLYKFDGVKDLALYNFRKDPMLMENLLEKEDSILNEMSNITKAVIQQYNNRMIHNCISFK